MSFEAASPQLTQRRARLAQRSDHAGRAVAWHGRRRRFGAVHQCGRHHGGAGNAYYRGIRDAGREALKQAGLEPLAPFGADDSELESTNSYAAGQTALLLYDSREALSWADLVYAIDLNGMNSSVSPLAQPVQANRPSSGSIGMRPACSTC